MFKNALRLPFKLLGIPLYLDITFLIVLPLLAWLIGSQLPDIVTFLISVDGWPDDPSLIEPLVEGYTPFLIGFWAALALFFSVVVHELGHAVTGRFYNVETERITLWLLGGMAHFKEMPKQRGAEAVVAIAGPITSIALGMIFFGLASVVPIADLPGLYFVLLYTAYMNIVLAVFNMVPALPLDGGRVLRSLLHLKMSRLRATQIAAGISKSLAIGLGLFGLLIFDLFLILIAFFVYMAVSAEAKYAAFTETLSRFQVRQLMSSPVATVGPAQTLKEVLDKMMLQARVAYPVITSSGDFIGEISLENVQQANPEQLVKEVMSRPPQTIGIDEDATELFDRMMRDEQHRLLVVDGDGMVVGIVTKTDLMRALQIASGTPQAPQSS